MTSDTTHLVFVYGTLRRGGRNHALLVDARYLGRGVTAQAYALYEDVDLYPTPYAVDIPRHPLVGEVYEVGPRTLAELDILEECPVCYRRNLVTVLLEPDLPVTAWLYLAPAPRGRLLPGGDWFLASPSARKRS